MKIQTTKATLAAVMKKAAKIANPKGMMPVYGHVAVSFDGTTCTITANDGERTYSEMFPAEGEPGQLTLEAQKLAKAVTGMKSGDIELGDGYIKQGRSRIRLEVLPYDHFPQPDYEDATDAGITGEQIADAVTLVGHAMGVKDVRAMLNGLHLCEGHAVATDGHRMAFVELPYTGPEIIIPAETARQAAGIEGTVSVSERQIVITGPTSRFSSLLVSARYVNWQRVVPKEFAGTATLDAEDFIAALKTAQLGDEMVKLSFGQGAVMISNKGAESECDCQCDIEADRGFKAQYLIDAIVAAGVPDITLQIGTDTGPSLINGNMVVMPVRL